MNDSAAAAADARNRRADKELSARESPDGLGTRWQEAPPSAEAAARAAAAEKERRAKLAALHAAQAEAARVEAAVEQAAFEQCPLLADVAHVLSVQDMDDSGRCRWLSRGAFCAQHPGARLVGDAARVAPRGYPFRTAGVSPMEYIIVSRHPAAIEFIRAWASEEFGAAPVAASATADDVRAKAVAGNLPLHLAAVAAEVWAVEFDGPPPRGAEYSTRDMVAAGARLARYRVQAL
jgi:hypothetical protein